MSHPVKLDVELDVELNLNSCTLRVERALTELSRPRRTLIYTLRWLFKLLFRRRWLLSVHHVQRALYPTYLGETSGDTSGDASGDISRDAERLADAALTSLAITVTGALKRALTPHQREIKRASSTTLKSPELSMSLEERVERLSERGVAVEGRERLIEALSSHRGVVILSAHLGAWEELISLGSWLNRPVWVISKRLKVGAAQRLWDRSRSSGPPRLDRGPRARRIIQALRDRGVVADVLDQHDPRASALSVNFLGRPAWTSPDLARLAILSDALILPLFLIRGERDQFKQTLRVGSVIDPQDVLIGQEVSRAARVKRVTELSVLEVERAVLSAPEQWLWLHRRWKTRRHDAQSD